MQWLSENQIPFFNYIYKTDKLSKNNLAKNLKDFKKKMLENWSELPNILLSSAHKKEGLKEILNYISFLNSEVN